MFTEDDLLPISAIQHLEFCPRRCALVHVEGVWTENAQTAEGRALHQRVHGAPSETVGGVRVTRGLRLCSRALGLTGVADVVEFHPREGDAKTGTGSEHQCDPPREGSRGEEPVPVLSDGVALPGLAGRWQPFPVEYKRGRRKPEMSYFVQLCAQALCLEEMLGAVVPMGALFHGKSKRRQSVTFDADLRRRTETLARQLHELVAAGRTPPPQPGPKCKFCSLAGICMPKLRLSRSVRDYVARQLAAILAE
jgi:CRISPR-associated exonuclease Cas4